MKYVKAIIMASLLSSLLIACTSSSAGKLEGTWQVTSEGNFLITFKNGKMISEGTTVDVKYTETADGVTVKMFNKSGEPGGTMHFTFSDNNSAKTDKATFKRVSS